MVRIFILIGGFALSSMIGMAQGIVNSAHIRLEGPVYVRITNGGFKNIASTIDGELDNDGTLYLEGNWTNNAANQVFVNRNGTGSVNFTGTSSQQINGSNSTSFENVTLSKSGINALTLQQNITINNTLTFASGMFDLQNYDITLGSTGSLSGESESSHIFVSDNMNHTGSISAQGTVNNTTSNIGNLGFIITTTDNLGTVDVIRTHQRKQGFGTHTGNYGISRAYNANIGEISENTNITFSYLAAELDGTAHPDESHLILYQLIDDGAKAHLYTPLDATINIGTNTIQTNPSPYNTWTQNHVGLSFLDEFTLGSEESILPIELLDFNIQCLSESTIEIKWRSASEINNDYYSIQRSEDLQNWTLVETVDGTAYSSSVKEYSLTDFINSSATKYYRLLQTDFNGNTYELDVKPISCSETQIDNEASIQSIQINGNTLTLKIFTPQDDAFELRLFDNLGRNFNQNKTILCEQGMNVIHINLQHKPTGIVYVSLVNETVKLHQKFLIK